MPEGIWGPFNGFAIHALASQPAGGRQRVGEGLENQNSHQVKCQTRALKVEIPCPAYKRTLGQIRNITHLVIDQGVIILR